MGRDGRFGRFGGQFVPETVMPALEELERLRRRVLVTSTFRRRYEELLTTWAGRPTPLYEARRLAEAWGGRCRILLKREDLNHTGAHKVLNALGQGLLAQTANKQRIVCETGAGQHGVATASVCALLDLSCTVYMGAVDMKRQQPNVERMRMLGARVEAVQSGTRTLKDATNEAIRDWVTNVRTTHYLIGSVVGPHPYPLLVRTFVSRIGREAGRQVRRLTGRLPDAVVACVGGGSNAMGIMHRFVPDRTVDLIAVEAGGRSSRLGEHAASLSAGRPGVLHGAYSFVLQDNDGQIAGSHSISAGLDYPGVGPELAALHESKRLRVVTVRDEQALDAFHECNQCEGILPALESAHALAFAKNEARKRPRGAILIVNLSGRGDKDLGTVATAEWSRQIPRGKVSVRGMNGR